ncbi:hypothetical protein EOM09_02740 [bacterium]|nr:hypothetical protein [bacterium]
MDRIFAILLLLVLIFTFIFLITILYALIAGLWGFNPTNIDWFNTKLLISALLGFCVNILLGTAIAKID